MEEAVAGSPDDEREFVNDMLPQLDQSKFVAADDYLV